MRILQLHSDFLEYSPISKEVEIADDVPGGTVRLDDHVVFFITVEKGDSEKILAQVSEELSSSLDTLKTNKVVLYPYSHLSRDLAPPGSALKLLKLLEIDIRNKGFEVHRCPFGWTKSFTIKVKGHPLAEQFKVISGTSSDVVDTSKALKSEVSMTSRWCILGIDGDLKPIADYNFSSSKRLEKLVRYELEKSRTVSQVPPHVELMKRLCLVDHEPGSDQGNLRYYPKGRLMKSLLERYVTQKVIEYGAVEVETPIMYDPNHPSLESYLQRFPARQYIVKSGDKELFLRFSACFGQFLMAKDCQISYKHLPFKMYELTRYSFRREKSGELVGLRRLRAFTMPDCHAFCLDMVQAKTEALTRFNLSVVVLNDIGIEKNDYELAMRFTEEFYENNKDFLISLVKSLGKPALVEIWPERFFYFTFKWEFNYIDNLDKASALSTDQIDVENAERYGITYTDPDGEKIFPIILHNSPSGAIERCMYALLEKSRKMQNEGKRPSLPFWVSPIQLRILPVSSKHHQAAIKLAENLGLENIRADVDDREESINKKVREAEKEWIRFVVIYGDREAESGLLPIRDRETGKISSMKAEDLVVDCHKLSGKMPFIPSSLPLLLSKRPSFI
ncbi:MAG: threonine--tRNA ligase [Chloroflexi bacterium]|nr:threonine--tRNA ligase [Chloroflexota bacterium]